MFFRGPDFVPQPRKITRAGGEGQEGIIQTEKKEGTEMELEKFMKEHVKVKHFIGGGQMLGYEREGERLRKTRIEEPIS